MHHIRYHRYQESIALLLALLVMPLAWSQQPLDVQEQQGISFVSGGFGQEERDQLQAMAGQFNLKFVFSLDAGNYLADVDVRIRDEQGSTLVETTSSGPIFLANLPEGNYTIAAANEGVEKARDVSAGSHGMTEVNFTWSGG